MPNTPAGGPSPPGADMQWDKGHVPPPTYTMAQRGKGETPSKPGDDPVSAAGQEATQTDWGLTDETKYENTEDRSEEPIKSKRKKQKKEEGKVYAVDVSKC